MSGITEALLASRRSFMVGAGALLFAQPKLILSQVPILWGDGEHDDTDALSALFTGKPVKTMGGDTFRSLFEDGWAALNGGQYLITDTIKTAAPMYITGATFFGPTLKGRAFMEFYGGKPPPGAKYHTVVKDCTFNALPRLVGPVREWEHMCCDDDDDYDSDDDWDD